MTVPRTFAFTMQPGTEALPFRIKEGISVKYNISLTNVEVSLLSFLYLPLCKAIELNAGELVISTRADNLEHFAQFQERHFQVIDPAERSNLVALVRSIWEKTRNYLDGFFLHEGLSAKREIFARECQESELFAQKIRDKGAPCEILNIRQTYLLADMLSIPHPEIVEKTEEVKQPSIQFPVSVSFGNSSQPVRMVSEGKTQYFLNLTYDEKCALTFTYLHLLEQGGFKEGAFMMLTDQEHVPAFALFRAKEFSFIEEAEQKTYHELLISIRNKIRELTRVTFNDVENTELKQKVLAVYQQQCENADTFRMTGEMANRQGVLFSASDSDLLTFIHDQVDK